MILRSDDDDRVAERRQREHIARCEPTLKAASRMPIRSREQAVALLELSTRYLEAYDIGAYGDAEAVVKQLALLVADASDAHGSQEGYP